MSDVADPLKEKRVELVLEQLEELPTLPAVAVRVLEVTSNDTSSAAEVVKLIASDPSLTARILKLVHSAGLGVRAEVNTVERAVVLLGFDAVRSTVLAVSIFQTFQGDTSPRSTNQAARTAGPAKTVTGGGFSREGFWRHSIAVASCAELIAKQLHGSWGRETRIDPSEAFVCGLLHDIGKVGMDAALPKSFAKVVEAVEILRGNIADVERQIVGIDHMVVGKRLAEKWKLPPTLRDCIWLHGQHPSALPMTVTKPALVNIVTLADILAREQHLGYSGNYVYPVAKKVLIDALGLNETQVNEVAGKLVEAMGVRAAAIGLGQTSSGELYQQALAQANRELSKVSTQLAVRNKKLAVRARFFDALAEFHGALRPDSPPGLVLRAVVETAQEALGVQGDKLGVAAFSVPPGQNYAEVIVGTGSAGGDAEGGGDFETMLVDCTARPRWAGPVGTVVPVGSGLEFVMGLVSPKLGGQKRYWTALLAEGEVVGGVIWGGANVTEEEAERIAQMKTELAGLCGGWSLALRTAQIRDEARQLSEQLAEANRNLQDAQSEVLRARTVVTIAEMAAGAAHEMNNPLAVISGRSQLLASILTEEKQKKSAALIAEQADRLSGMITELMEFAKPKPPVMRASPVSELVEKGIADAKARPGLADRKVLVEVRDVPLVHVDPMQIAAALAEIVDNALSATETNKGRVMVHAAHDAFGGQVVITVADEGTGMDEHTLRRAFDPFFSSKPAGRRRGMGLAKAQRWIEGCGGSVRLESQVGSGTRVMVLLPAANRQQETPSNPAPAKPATSRRVAG